MTPQEKAIEIIKKFIPHAQYWDCYNDELLEENHTKQCALIAVEEILKRTRSVDTMPSNYQKIDENTKEYWEQVKIEIEKL